MCLYHYGAKQTIRKGLWTRGLMTTNTNIKYHTISIQVWLVLMNWNHCKSLIYITCRTNLPLSLFWRSLFWHYGYYFGAIVIFDFGALVSVARTQPYPHNYTKISFLNSLFRKLCPVRSWNIPSCHVVLGLHEHKAKPLNKKPRSIFTWVEILQTYLTSLSSHKQIYKIMEC